MPILSAPSIPSSATNDPVLAALAAKRAEIDARRGALSEQLTTLERELATLDGAMQLLAFPKEAKPKARVTSSWRVQQVFSFLRGELGREVMSVLRIANRPLTAQQIGRTLCESRQVTLDAAVFRRLCMLIVGNLRRRQARGFVHSVGYTERNAVLWIMAPANAL
ncbi:hypothetical protein [Azospirillum doebereinerae]